MDSRPVANRSTNLPRHGTWQHLPTGLLQPAKRGQPTPPLLQMAVVAKPPTMWLVQWAAAAEARSRSCASVAVAHYNLHVATGGHRSGCRRSTSCTDARPCSRPRQPYHADMTSWPLALLKRTCDMEHRRPSPRGRQEVFPMHATHANASAIRFFYTVRTWGYWTSGSRTAIIVTPRAGCL